MSSGRAREEMRPRNPRRALLVPVLIVLLGLALRLFGIGRESLWFDEAMTVALARAPIADALPHLARQEFHPPLYFWLAWVWMKLVGGADWQARLLSALLGTLSIVAAHVLAGRLFDRRTADLSALLVAISQVLVYYSQEARPYAASLFAFLCAAVLL